MWNDAFPYPDGMHTCMLFYQLVDKLTLVLSPATPPIVKLRRASGTLSQFSWHSNRIFHNELSYIITMMQSHGWRYQNLKVQLIGKNVFYNNDDEQSDYFRNCRFSTLMMLSRHLEGIVSL